MTVKVFTIAHLPEELYQSWLQHLRDFDIAHPDCHFEVAADCPEMRVEEMVEAMRIEPMLTFQQFIERKRST